MGGLDAELSGIRHRLTLNPTRGERRPATLALASAGLVRHPVVRTRDATRREHQSAGLIYDRAGEEQGNTGNRIPDTGKEDRIDRILQNPYSAFSRNLSESKIAWQLSHT